MYGSFGKPSSNLSDRACLADTDGVSTQSSNSAESVAPSLAPGLRWGISLLVSLHLLAVFIAPFSLPPSSRLSNYPRRWLRPYIDAAYLDHGYRFFAPEPGSESHLVRYELKFADGKTQRGEFPSLREHWPRLFYHRHFMLSEFLNQLDPGEAPPDSAPPEAFAEYRRQREMFEAFAQSYATHLIDHYQADEVTLIRVRHRIPSPGLVMERGVQLDDPESYVEDQIGVYSKPQAQP